MKTKGNRSKKEKTVVLSVGSLTKAGIGIVDKVLKKADDVKKSKITITLEKDN